MPHLCTRSRIRRLAVGGALGGLALSGVAGLTGTWTTSATYTSTQDAGAASFTTRLACSAGTAYPSTVVALGPTLYYRFGEPAAPSPATVADSSGSGHDGSVVTGVPAATSVAFGAASPVWCDDTGAMAQPAVDRTATTAGFVGWPSLRTHPQVFTLLAWVQTAPGTSTGGRVMGFGDSVTGVSTEYDRHLYLDNAGHVVFGISNGTPATLTSGVTVNDGKPHQLAASLGPAGGRLYVDGALVASDATWTDAAVFDGYWRIGWDSLSGWGTATDPADFGLDGVIDEAAVFEGTELTPGEIAATYAANHW